MTVTLQSVAGEILTYMRSSGIGFPKWYVGIASDPRTRLFVDHSVSKNSYWIYQDAGSDGGAREIEKFLVDTYSTQGGGGGGDESTRYVYAYVVTATTKE